MTRNDCFTAGRKITPKGIMVHSTATPGVMAADWFNRWNKSYKAGETNRQVCVHALLMIKGCGNTCLGITEGGIAAEQGIILTLALKFVSRVVFRMGKDLRWLAITFPRMKPILERLGKMQWNFV